MRQQQIIINLAAHYTGKLPNYSRFHALSHCIGSLAFYSDQISMHLIKQIKMHQYHQLQTHNIPRPFAYNKWVVCTWPLSQVHIIWPTQIIDKSNNRQTHLGKQKDFEPTELARLKTHYPSGIKCHQDHTAMRYAIGQHLISPITMC